PAPTASRRGSCGEPPHAHGSPGRHRLADPRPRDRHRSHRSRHPHSTRTHHHRGDTMNNEYAPTTEVVKVRYAIGHGGLSERIWWRSEDGHLDWCSPEHTGTIKQFEG